MFIISEHESTEPYLVRDDNVLHDKNTKVGDDVGFIADDTDFTGKVILHSGKLRLHDNVFL